MAIKNGRYKDKNGNVRHFETNENMVVVDNGEKTLKQKLSSLLESLSDLIKRITALESNKIDKAQIKNNLAETVSGNVLDATQGKILADKIEALNEASYGSTLKTLTDVNLNDFSTDGEYWVNGDTCINIPTIEKEYGKLKVKKLADNFVWQEYITVTNKSFRRSKNGGAWNAWERVSTNITSLNKNDFVPNGTNLNTLTDGLWLLNAEYTYVNSPMSNIWATVTVYDKITTINVVNLPKTYITHNNMAETISWQEVATKSVELIASQTDILSYAKTLKQHDIKTVRCNSAKNNPLGDAYNDFYYTIYCTDHINGYWNIVATDIMTGDTYTQVCTANVWRGWQQIATTNKISNLSLLNGWTNSSSCLTTIGRAGDVVTISGVVSNASVTTNSIIATLPEWARANRYQGVVGFVYNNPAKGAYFTVDINHNLMIQGSFEANLKYAFTLSYTV